MPTAIELNEGTYIDGTGRTPSQCQGTNACNIGAHYERGINGQTGPLFAAWWGIAVGLPCDQCPAGLFKQVVGNNWDPSLNPEFLSIVDQYTQPDGTVNCGAVVAALYSRGQTIITPEMSIADDYRVTCNLDFDSAAHAGDCPAGFYKQIGTETCVIGFRFNPLFPYIPPRDKPSCPPPGQIKLVNGVPVCMMDPPVPSNLPSWNPLDARAAIQPLLMTSSRTPSFSGTTFRPGVSQLEERIRAREGVTIQRAQLEFSASFLALDPTRKGAPAPFIFKGCGCGSDNSEELIANGAL
jgi:hypothetical protein